MTGRSQEHADRSALPIIPGVLNVSELCTVLTSSTVLLRPMKHKGYEGRVNRGRPERAPTN